MYSLILWIWVNLSNHGKRQTNHEKTPAAETAGVFLRFICQKAFFHFQVARRVVRCQLGFAQVVAEGAAADGEDRGALDALGDGEAGDEAPPPFQVVDEGFGRREELMDVDGAADVLFQGTVDVPFEDRFWSRPLPAFDEGGEEVIVIGIDDRVALAFGDILFVRQFGTGDDVDAALRDDFAVEDAFIEIAGQVVDLMLPQVCRGSQVAGAVAVKGRIADGQFGFIGIAREDAAKSSCRCGQDTAGAVAGLDVFFDEARQFQLPLVLAALAELCLAELAPRQFQAVLDGDDRIQAADVVGQFLGQALGHVRVVAAGHVDQEDVFRRQDRRIEGGVDRRVDAARDAEDDFVDANGIHEGFQAVVHARVDVIELPLFRLQEGRRDQALRRFIEIDDGHFFSERRTFDVL